MTEFRDGPAEGQTLWLRRCPVFLRVVSNGLGEWDALDQIPDKPKPCETIYAYRRLGNSGSMHLRVGGRNRAAGGMYRTGIYELVAPQPSEATLRDNKQWQQWCNLAWERSNA